MRATRRNDSLPEAWNNLASVEAVAGRYEEALRHYERARELDPGNVGIHFNEGLTCLALDKPGPAEASFREALRLREGYGAARVRLALALARQGRTKEARKTMRPLEQRSVLPALALRDMAEVYFLSGDDKRAFRHLQLAKKGGIDVEAVEALMQKGPGRPREVETEDLIEQARAYHRTGHNELARELLREAAEREPEDTPGSPSAWEAPSDRDDDLTDATMPGMPRPPILLTVLALVALLPPVVSTAQQPTNRDHSDYTRMRGEGYPIRAEVAVVSAQEVDLRGDDLVLGVVVGGEARAYPVNLMWKPENEVLNDRLGGAAITATW